MPDITMCATRCCPMRSWCYRAQAKPSEYWQAWANFGPAPNCRHHWPWSPPWRVMGPTFDVDTFWHLPIGGGPGPGMFPGASSYTRPQTCGAGHWAAHDERATCTADEVPR